MCLNIVLLQLGLPTSVVLLLDNVSTAAAYPSPSLWSDYTKLHRWPAAA